MAYLSLICALFPLLSLDFFYWAPLVFSLRVLVSSVYILLANVRSVPGTRPSAHPEDSHR